MADTKADHAFQLAEELKERGNRIFKQDGTFKDMCEAYESALRILKMEEPDPLPAKWTLLVSVIHANLALAMLKAKDYTGVFCCTMRSTWLLLSKDTLGKRGVPLPLIGDPQAASIFEKAVARRMLAAEALGNLGFAQYDQMLLEEVTGKNSTASMQQREKHAQTLKEFRDTQRPGLLLESSPPPLGAGPDMSHAPGQCYNWILGGQSSYPIPQFKSGCSANAPSGQTAYFGGGCTGSIKPTKIDHFDPDHFEFAHEEKFRMLTIKTGPEKLKIPSHVKKPHRKNGLLPPALRENLQYAVQIAEFAFLGAGPQARQGASLVVFGEDIFLWGGYLSHWVIGEGNMMSFPLETRDMWRLDKKHSWSRYQAETAPGQKQLPQAAAFHSAVLDTANGPARLLIYGGLNTLAGGFVQPLLWSYSIANRTWEILWDQVCGMMPDEDLFDHRRHLRSGVLSFNNYRFLAGHVAWMCGGELYVFGGMVGHKDGSPGFVLSDEVWAFGLGTRIWRLIDVFGNPPSPRAHCGITVLEGGKRVIIIGGRTGVSGTTFTYSPNSPKETTALSNEVFEFTTEKTHWRKIVTDESGGTWLTGCAEICPVLVPELSSALIFGGVTAAGPRSDAKSASTLTFVEFPSKGIAPEIVKKHAQFLASREFPGGKKGGQPQVSPAPKPAELPGSRRINEFKETDLFIDSIVIEKGKLTKNPYEKGVGPWAVRISPRDPSEALGCIWQADRFYQVPAKGYLSGEQATDQLLAVKVFSTRKAAKEYFRFAFATHGTGAAQFHDRWEAGEDTAALCDEFGVQEAHGHGARGRFDPSLLLVCMVVVDRFFAKATVKYACEDVLDPEFIVRVFLPDHFNRRVRPWAAHLRSFSTNACRVECGFCHRRSDLLRPGDMSLTLKVCGGCGFNRYCSEECLKQDIATRDHDKICQAGSVKAILPQAPLPPNRGFVDWIGDRNPNYILPADWVIGRPGVAASRNSTKLGAAPGLQMILVALLRALRPGQVRKWLTEGEALRDFLAAEVSFNTGPDSGLFRGIVDLHPWAVVVMLEPGPNSPPIDYFFDLILTMRPDNTVDQVKDLMSKIGDDTWSPKIIGMLPEERARSEAAAAAVVAFMVNGVLLHPDRTLKEVVRHCRITGDRLVHMQYLSEQDATTEKNRLALRPTTVLTQEFRLTVGSDEEWRQKGGFQALEPLS